MHNDKFSIFLFSAFYSYIVKISQLRLSYLLRRRVVVSTSLFTASSVPISLSDSSRHLDICTYSKSILGLSGAGTHEPARGRRLGDSIRGLGNVGEINR